MGHQNVLGGWNKESGEEGAFIFLDKGMGGVWRLSLPGTGLRRRSVLVQVRTKPGRVSCQDTARTQLTYP